MSSRKLFLLCALGAAALGFIAAALLSHRDDRRAPPIGEFTLVDQQQRPVTRKIFEDRWSVLYLGFTHCPDVCPTTLAMLRQVDGRMQAAGEKLQIVFLSADPERDTPEVIARYLRAFDPRFVGLTGTRSEIDKLCRSLGLGYLKNPGVNGEYTVDHSAAVVLIDPKMRAAGYLRPPFDPDRLVTELSGLIRSQR